MATGERDPFIQIGSTPKIERFLGGAIALSPVEPLVADTGDVDGKTILRITNYRTGETIGSAPIALHPHTLAFSPDGQFIFAMPGGKRSWNLLQVYSAPWNASRLIVEEKFLEGFFHGAWLNDYWILISGLKDSGLACIAAFDVTGKSRFPLREGYIVGNQTSDDEIVCSACSPSGLVAFSIKSRNKEYSYSYKTRVDLYQIRLLTYDGLFVHASSPFQEGPSYYSPMLLAEDGRTLICPSSASYYGTPLTLFDIEGNKLDSLNVSPREAGIAYRHGTLCVRNKDKTEIHRVINGKFHLWGSRYSGGGDGCDLMMQDDRMIVAIAEDDQTNVYEMVDFDVVKLSSDDLALRVTSARSLGARRFRPAWPDLARLLWDDATELRQAAIEALVEIGDPAALPEMIRAIGHNTDQTFRGLLESALLRFPISQLSPVIFQCLERPAVVFRRGAARALEIMPSIEAVEQLCEAIHDGDREIRLTVARALRKRANVRACPALLAHLNDEDEEVRRAVEQAVLATLKSARLLSDRAIAQLSSPIDVAAYAGAVIATGRMQSFEDFGVQPAGEFLSSLANACLQGERTLPQILNAVESLIVPPEPSAEQSSAEIGLTVALICADALRKRKRWQEAAALYQRVVDLAKQANAPQIEWRAWWAAGECFEAMSEDSAALIAFRSAMDVIDAMWFALLDEDKLRDFFQDKASLYDHAGLCALRLCHTAFALECLEKAKTRYLGDLIARRQMDPQLALDQELREFWQDVGELRPMKATAGSARLKGKERVEIIAAEWGRGEPGGVTVKPERLAAIEETCRNRPDLSGHLEMIQSVWRLMSYVSFRNDDRLRELIEELYQALALIYQAVRSGALPVAQPDRRLGLRRFNEAAQALVEIWRRETPQSPLVAAGAPETTERSHPGNHLWLFNEYRNWWNGVIAEASDKPAPGEAALFLNAVMEALNSVLHHEAVLGVVDESGGAAQEGLVFVTRTLKSDGAPAKRSTTIIQSALERRSRSRWRYVTELARGASVGYREVATNLQGRADLAHLQFSVTEHGTAVYIAHERDLKPGQNGMLPDLRGVEGLQVFTFPEINLASLRDRLLLADDGWFASYRKRRDPQGFESWMSAMDRTLEWLYAQLIAPLDRFLKLKEIKRLRVVPHRGLHLIPFAAMYRVNGGARRYLIDDYEIEYAPSATLQNICRRRATGRDSQGGLTAIANPTSDLPFADFEADEICSHFTAADVESLRGQQARREAFTTARSTLHFAGHGRYDWNDPLGSHLLFAGGERLTLADLFDEAVQLPKTSLVILSACETSVTDPEDLADEYLGLASGFLFAGTPAVISTLWAVDDISTSLMMARFYQKHLCEGLRPGEALRAAQIWLRRKASHHLVEKHARATLARLKKQCAQTPQWSEEEAALNNQINRLELRIADLQTQNQFDSREKPFAHPHYWAAFTLSGASVEADPNEM